LFFQIPNLLPHVLDVAVTLDRVNATTPLLRGSTFDAALVLFFLRRCVVFLLDPIERLLGHLLRRLLLALHLALGECSIDGDAEHILKHARHEHL